ncbi:MAG TPA: zinc ribbon domain-containing protein [Jatrophihabitans sp.]|jgi:hypothetical protein
MSEKISAAYWAGAEQGKLVIQRCDRCGTLRHYPRIICSACQSFDWSPYEASLSGTVHSWTVSHHVFDPSVTSDVPYTLVTVDMTDGVRVLGRLSNDVELRPQLRVQLTFTPDTQGRPGPTFVVADS